MMRICNTLSSQWPFLVLKKDLNIVSYSILTDMHRYSRNYGEIGDICNAQQRTISIGAATYTVQSLEIYRHECLQRNYRSNGVGRTRGDILCLFYSTGLLSNCDDILTSKFLYGHDYQSQIGAKAVVKLSWSLFVTTIPYCLLDCLRLPTVMGARSVWVNISFLPLEKERETEN